MLRSASGHLETGPGRIRTYDQGIHLAPAFPPGVDYLFTRARTVRVGAGSSFDTSQGRSSPQVVSAPSAGVPAARSRVDTGRHPHDRPRLLASTSRVSARRHLV